MRDVVVLAVITAFFALCVAYVWWCDRIIGPDPDVSDDHAVGELVRADAEEVLA